MIAIITSLLRRVRNFAKRETERIRRNIDDEFIIQAFSLERAIFGPPEADPGFLIGGVKFKKRRRVNGKT